MDVLRIPNYSAVLPGTEDYIWVYSGKGPTRAQAQAARITIFYFLALSTNIFHATVH